MTTYELLFPEGIRAAARAENDNLQDEPPPAARGLGDAIEGLNTKFDVIYVGLLSSVLIAALALLGMTLLGAGAGLLPSVPIEHLWVANIIIFVGLATVSITAVARFREALSSSIYEIEARGEELECAQAKLRRIATTDGLTNLLNRSTVLARLDEEASRASRYRRPLSVLMLDLDEFKRFNDTWGHRAGDEVLRQSARVFHESIRSQDILGRFGGEEFVVVLPETDRVEANRLAERLRLATDELTLMFEGTRLSPTVSIGVATLAYGEDPGKLLSRADEALYAAKRGGRNRVC